MELFFWIMLLLVTGSAVYHLICLYSAAAFFLARPKNIPEFTPPVTILKPIRGVDDRAYDCLASYCKQDYPDYEMIIGVRDANDPAVQLVEKLKKDFPQRKIKLVINPNTIGVSMKVSNLHNMFPEAQNELLVIADSDILVGPDYLRAVVAPLADEKTGLVTCLYRAIGSVNFSALMETIGITGEFMLGVLVARQLEGVKFALGSTIATRKTVLEKFGGFAAIADYLADDFLLGNLASRAGYQVCLSHYIVETVLPSYRFSDFIRHQLRWARGTKYSRPSGYIGMIFTFTTALALLLIAIFHSSLPAILAGLIALAIRLIAAWLIGGVGMKDRRLKRYFYLLPIRDLISFFIWLASFSGNTVHWRGDRFRLIAGGRLVPVEKYNAPAN